MKTKTTNITLAVDTDHFIILRGALNRFQIERIRSAERIGKQTPDGVELLHEANMAKFLFDEADRQWNNG